MRFLQISAFIVGLSQGVGAAFAQDISAPSIDFDALLATCAGSNAICTASLEIALAEITMAKLAGLSLDTVDTLLGSLATVAVATAQQRPTSSTSMSSVINSIAQEASPERQQALGSIITNIDTTDLTPIAGSQSGG